MYLYSNVLFQLREILLEYQVSLNEQVRQAKYESARKVQKYYLKCLHQLVNGEAESMQLCTHTGIIQMFAVVFNQVLAKALNTSHLIPSRAEHLTHVKLQESLIIHTEDLSVVVILHRIFNLFIIYHTTEWMLFMLCKYMYSKMKRSNV